MRNSPWFNLVFMLIITAIFTGTLSGIYEFTKPTIQINEELSIKRAQLYAFNIKFPVDAPPEDIERIYENQIEVKPLEDGNMYIAKGAGGRPEAYGFTFAGGALWGEVEGILALSPDLKQVIGIDFTEQNETPGLGGRIGEPKFKEQFRNIQLNDEGSPLVYGSSSREGQIDAITGATLTSNSVLDILNKKIEQVKKSMDGDQW